MQFENLQKIFKRVDKLPWQVMANEALVVEPDKNRSHELDAVGAFIWQQADGSKDVAAIAEEVCHHFEVELETAQQDVYDFTCELNQKGLLDCQN